MTTRHADWLALHINRCQTGGGAYPGDIRETGLAPGFDVDSLDAPEEVPAGGMKAPFGFFQWRYGSALTAGRA